MLTNWGMAIERLRCEMRKYVILIKLNDLKVLALGPQSLKIISCINFLW